GWCLQACMLSRLAAGENLVRMASALAGGVDGPESVSMPEYRRESLGSQRPALSPPRPSLADHRPGLWRNFYHQAADRIPPRIRPAKVKYVRSKVWPNPTAR